LTIYLPLIFLLVLLLFTMAFSGMELQLQYYTILSTTVMTFPAALNSLVTMLLIGHYRRRVFAHFSRKITSKKANNGVIQITQTNLAIQQLRQSNSQDHGIRGAQRAISQVESGRPNN
jgi:hypothetical protein